MAVEEDVATKHSGDLKVTTSSPSSLKDDAPGTIEAGTASGATVSPEHFAHEAALVLKFDLRILPVLAFMYLCNSLDKGNLGNAKTDHMEDDLNFKDNQYNIILSVFFVPYVIFAAPIAFLGKKYGPSVVLPILMASFGSFTLLSAAVHNFGGMMAVRWFLGKSIWGGEEMPILRLGLKLGQRAFKSLGAESELTFLQLPLKSFWDKFC